MRMIAFVMTAFVALSHVGIMILEVTGAFGGMTAKTSILFTQGLPALLALLVVLAMRPDRTR